MGGYWTVFWGVALNLKTKSLWWGSFDRGGIAMELIKRGRARDVLRINSEIEQNLMKVREK